MPAIVLLYGVFAGWLGDAIGRQLDAGPTVYGVVDEARVLDLSEDLSASLMELPAELRSAIEARGEGAEALGALARYTDTVFRGFPDLEAAKEALLAEEIPGFAVIPEDFIAVGRIDTYTAGFRLSSGTARENLAGLLQEQLLLQAPGEVRARITDPIASRRQFLVDDNGDVVPNDRTARILRIAVPAAFIIVFLVSLLTTTGYLVQGTATEKESRVVEVLLSATSPDEILAGKLLGLGAAGLLQVVVWFSMVIAGTVIVAGVAMAAGVAFPFKALLVGTVFFVAAYFFYGSIMLAFASFGNTEMEAQKVGGMWTILATIPLFFMPAVINSPHGTTARVLSWIPFTSPLTVLSRMAFDPEGMALWDLGLALAILLVSTWLVLRIGARLFRIGLLAIGSRPKLREIWRQARLSS
jgi:ABC-2 type transport system permease protein